MSEGHKETPQAQNNEEQNVWNDEQPVAPPPPTLPGVTDADMRFAPPSAKPEPPQKAAPAKSEPIPDIEPDPAPIAEPKIYTPKEDRFPPLGAPRELPPEIEQSRNLYPEKHKKTPEPKRKGGGILSGGIIFLSVLLIGGIVAYGVFIFQNPYSPWNPLAPPTPFPVVITATFLPPTETRIPSPTPLLPTNTPISTEAASVATALPFSIDTGTSSTATPLPLSTNNAAVGGEGRFITLVPSPENVEAQEEARFPFQLLQPPGIVYATNENGRECEWLSIAGTVVDLNGEPSNGLRVRFVNQLTQEENTVFTGSSATFGDGGFEFVIGTAPEINGYFVQLLSQTSQPLSEEMTIVTSGQCEQNVAIVNFEQIAPF